MRPTAFRLRAALLAAVVLSWAIAVWRMWVAFRTPPSAARLEQERMVQIPTLPSLAWEVGKSLLELALVVLLLWPASGRRYALRVAGAGAVLLSWFLVTTPLDLSTMEWVHRRWLALVALSLLLIGAVLALAGAWRRLRGRRGG